jgi:hypothetical protein
MFGNEFLGAFYKKPIALFTDSELDRKKPSIFLDYSTVATIHFSVFIPFNYENLKMEEKCYTVEELPRFFRDQPKYMENTSGVMTGEDMKDESYIEEPYTSNDDDLFKTLGIN